MRGKFSLMVLLVYCVLCMVLSAVHGADAGAGQRVY